MRRRRLDATSGLDLFLDAICNTFGGIVFISMLVVVLINATNVSSVEDPTATPPPDPTRSEELRREQAALGRQIRRLEETAEIVRDSTDLTRSLGRIKEERTITGRLRSELDDVTQRLAETNAETDRITEERRRKSETRTAKRKELDILKTRLAREIAARTKRLALPFEKATSLTEKALLPQGRAICRVEPGGPSSASPADSGRSRAPERPSPNPPLPPPSRRCFQHTIRKATILPSLSGKIHSIVGQSSKGALRRKGFSYRLLLLSKDEVVRTGRLPGGRCNSEFVPGIVVSRNSRRMKWNTSYESPG